MKSILLLFLCISVVYSISKRSTHWDAHLDHLRSKRQFPAGCNERSSCQNPLANDVLGRRASGILATPQSQGMCGSCWAFASTHTYSDTLSIAAGMATSPLSPQFTASCQQNHHYVVDGNGCCGGYLEAGFSFIQREGAVTDSCAPYHSSLHNFMKTISGPKPSISHTCPVRCNDGTTFNPSALRLHGYKELRTEAEVVTALNDRTVYLIVQLSASFFGYECGIFCESVGFESEGAHAMEIVDYGTQNGVDFWVVKNSWDTDWGENGYIRMRRGDTNVRAYVTPVLSSDEVTQPLSSSASGISTCAARDVENPSNDVLVMSAIEHVIEEINDEPSRRIRCPDGTSASSVTLGSVADASEQVVDGVMVEVDIVVNVLGCDEDNLRAHVDAAVLLLPNNTFETTAFSLDFESDSGGSGVIAVTNYIAMTMFLLLAILLAL